MIMLNLYNMLCRQSKFNLNLIWNLCCCNFAILMAAHTCYLKLNTAGLIKPIIDVDFTFTNSQINYLSSGRYGKIFNTWQIKQ